MSEPEAIPAEVRALMYQIFEEHITFNKELGLKIKRLASNGAELRFQTAD